MIKSPRGGGDLPVAPMLTIELKTINTQIKTPFAIILLNLKCWENWKVIKDIILDNVNRIDLLSIKKIEITLFIFTKYPIINNYNKIFDYQ